MRENGFVRIDPRFLLRGWEGQPFALVDGRTATAHFVTRDVFDTLLLCDGRLRPSNPLFFGPGRARLGLLEREGVLAFSDEPCSLEPRQEYRTYPNHYMRQVQWSLTGRCNYRCRHCYMSAPHAVLGQPSTEECLTIVDQMAEAGVLAVKLTGGEPLVHPGFLRIVECLCERGIAIATILTNGELVTEELLCALEEQGVLCGFDISFDGTHGCHDWLRGVDGAGKAAVRAFGLCREHGFPTGAQYVLHRGNIDVLRESVRLLGDLGVETVSVGAVSDEGEAHGMRDLILRRDEVFDILCTYLPQFLEDGAPLPRLNLGGVFVVERGRVRLVRESDCGEGCAARPACDTIRSTMYLNPDGYILPCASMAYDEGVKKTFPNLSDTTISQALSDSSYLDCVRLTVADVLERNPRCRACAYLGRCMGGCRANAVDEAGAPSVLGMDRASCSFFTDGRYERAAGLVRSLQG